MATAEDCENMVWALGSNQTRKYVRPGNLIVGFKLHHYYDFEEWFLAKVERIEGDPWHSTVIIREFYKGLKRPKRETRLEEYEFPWAFDVGASPAGTQLYKIPLEPFSSIPAGQKIVTCGQYPRAEWKPATIQEYDSRSGLATIQYSNDSYPVKMSFNRLQPFLVEVVAPVTGPSTGPGGSANP
jgi:hypothetical protein